MFDFFKKRNFHDDLNRAIKVAHAGKYGASLLATWTPMA